MLSSALKGVTMGAYIPLSCMFSPVGNWYLVMKVYFPQWKWAREEFQLSKPSSELTTKSMNLIIFVQEGENKMKSITKPFVSNFFTPIAIEISHSKEYDERKQICLRSLEDLRNSTNTSSAPTNDADSDAADSATEL